MNHQHEFFLLHHAHQVLRERRSMAEGHAQAPRRPMLRQLRARMAVDLGRFARVLAAVAEDLDPAATSSRPLRG